MNREIYDNTPQFPDGIDPRAAANEFQTLLAAGGKSQSIVAQLAALRIWAEETGRKIDANRDIKQARLGGLEHCARPNPFLQFCKWKAWPLLRIRCSC